MEQVHGVDVSWMTQGSPKDRLMNKSAASMTTTPTNTPAPAVPRQMPGPIQTPTQSLTTNKKPNGQVNGHADASPTNGSPLHNRQTKPPPTEKQPGHNGAPLQRRNSWFSNISAKFSPSPIQGSAGSPPNITHLQHQQHQQQQQAQLHQQHAQQQQSAVSEDATNHNATASDADPLPPKTNPARNAVLQHAIKQEGDAPYTPAPPKSAQAGFLGVFRRLSSSQGSNPAAGKLTHGLVDRKVFNVDKNRSRCPMVELKDSKLRRVSFCVDVEIAPMPKYANGEAESPVNDTVPKKKMTEKGEGAALKRRLSGGDGNEDDEAGVDAKVSLPVLNQQDKVKQEKEEAKVQKDSTEKPADETTSPTQKDEPTKKKEKKKRSEEERKARKEKKRQLAEANGSIPMEIRYDSSDSSTGDSPVRAIPKRTTLPTTNPVRIYRRCCQLRETPILKKITEQLLDSANASTETGIVNRLDLTNYPLQLPDLITLGDYLAVVPVKEVLLEDIGLTDEGLRVILAGLLAAKLPDPVKRKPKHELETQGGVVERVVLKNNKLGPDGWKYICLFLYLCQSLKYLDISNISFPQECAVHKNGDTQKAIAIPKTISELLSKCLAERLGGSALELVNLGGTEPSMHQLGIIIDGIIRCGVNRLGLANNHLDESGVKHVARYLAAKKCQGLDLGGNDLKEHIEAIAEVVTADHPLCVLSLSGCNLDHQTLCKIMPQLIALDDFRFIDLSHNQDLFRSSVNAVGMLRRCLPRMDKLKRLHLQDVGLTPEQAIALIEILPEMENLAHVNFLNNTELAKLAMPKTAEEQESACALYASLIAAARVSDTLVAVDLEVPNEGASEIVRAMAKQLVAYCLRNMERIQDIDTSLVQTISGGSEREVKEAGYSDALAHLVGHDVMDQDEPVDAEDAAPDEDYVIGGTGVVKALQCCLERYGDDSQGYGLVREDGTVMAASQTSMTTGGKAKDMSKHLLASARRIRRRLQPALQKAKSTSDDENTLRKLIFLDDTLQGIIKRFEDEYPDTREPERVTVVPMKKTKKDIDDLGTSPPTVEDYAAVLSDGEDDAEIHPSKPLSRSNSMLSKTLDGEEGSVLRAAQRFRSGYLTQQHFNVLAGLDDITTGVHNVAFLQEFAEDVGGDFLEIVKKKGVIRAFQEDKETCIRDCKASDPEHWDRFEESQQKTRANVAAAAGDKDDAAQIADESAISD